MTLSEIRKIYESKLGGWNGLDDTFVCMEPAHMEYLLTLCEKQDKALEEAQEIIQIEYDPPAAMKWMKKYEHLFKEGGEKGENENS